MEKDQERVVSCNGGSEASGHPIVYIKIKEGEGHPCPYCNQLLKK